MTWEVALSPLVEFIRSGESIAQTKGQRLAPLAFRIAGHEITKRIRSLRAAVLKI
jgi:hypothetical protein